MKKEMNNKGFSLVELIIVVAIMAVLIGVLAPAYLQYVEKSKKTKDCSAVGSIMDAAEIVAADPAIPWTKDEALNVSVSTAATYSGNAGQKAIDQMADIVEVDNAQITGSWGEISFEAVKQANGTVKFYYVSGGMDVTSIEEVTPSLAVRFE
jgi:prepilin-type N-terminal cleavage/methylation domain-containing protein